MAEFYDKFDYTVPEQAKGNVVDEAHTIPGAPHIIFLRHIPKEDDPSTVSIPGYVEVSSDPGPGEFRVFYGESGFGQVEFNAADATDAISVDYVAAGSVIWAETYDGGNREGVNHLQDAVSDHVADTLNPHQVSLEQARQVGAVLEGLVTFLHSIVMDGGIEDRRFQKIRDISGVEHLWEVLQSTGGEPRIRYRIDSVTVLEIRYRSSGDLANVTAGSGYVVTSPDGLSEWRIRVNDDGDLVTEEIV
jgi:hypothetical protein